MDPKDIIADVATLKKGAEGHDKDLQRLELWLRTHESEIKKIVENRANIEKQYEGIFSELQHKFNEVVELKENFKKKISKLDERDKYLLGLNEKLKDDFVTHCSKCESHKKATAIKSIKYMFLNETEIVVKILFVFSVVFIVGLLIGWENMLKWLIKILA